MRAVCAKPASRSADLAVSATKVASVSLACASARVLVHALIPEEALAELVQRLEFGGPETKAPFQYIIFSNIHNDVAQRGLRARSRVELGPSL